MTLTRLRANAAVPLLFLAGLIAAYVAVTAYYHIGVAHADPAVLAPAVTIAPAPAEAPPSTLTLVMIIGTAILGLIGTVLGAVSMALHKIAPLTKTTIDDRLRDEIDAGKARYDALLAMIVKLIPGAASLAPIMTTVNLAPEAEPQSAPAAPVTVNVAGPAALLAILLLGLGAATLPACSHLDTVKADTTAVAKGAVTCAKADVPAVKALGLQLVTEALVSEVMGNGIPWAQLEAEAEAGAKAQGIAVGSCAFGQLIADIAKVLPPPTAQGLMAAPTDDGRAELAAFKARLGVAEIRLGSGQVL